MSRLSDTSPDVVSEITDVWFRSRLPLPEIARRVGLQDAAEDAENHWAWVIGTLGSARLDITRTHTRPARMVDTRVFVVDGKFTEKLLADLVERLRRFVAGPIRCGRWAHRAGNDFDLVVIREFGATGSASDAEQSAAPDRDDK